MIVIPAVDIYQGKTVRMEQGRESKILFSLENPFDVAFYWYKKGAKALHVIDLQGAIVGDEESLPIIEKIIKNIPIPVEVGGGIRTIEKIEKILSFGAWRVIFSSLLKENKDFLRNLRLQFGEKIIPSIDVMGNSVVIKGWKENISWNEVIDKIEYAGFREVIFTDVSRDGTLQGINVKLIRNVLENTNFYLWIAGGISSTMDIEKLKEINGDYGNRIKGVIVGRALYEGKIDLGEFIC
ncbi:MAG: 1-(5-phosphoribosyl)-5-((5-phosphoribosylamino)methylideneamino)imidazole-4-carboxamide isomerase [Dictyoglomus sp. NZ13-RE01]|nr:MAG: 1-(5-phosphoribosyl)-5-((5-phosphoribosylamino)methylideneamino)imidazole-4-carboxamide isomerase [Dictyoglomus sp. NZ13-RE01]